MENDFIFSEQKDEAFYIRIDEDLDYAFALSLQDEESEVLITKEFLNDQTTSGGCSSSPLGIIDEQWEVIDPNPDIHALFLQYNSRFFYGKLEGVEVRWSPRMTLCAGVCCYEGRGGLCSVRLSVPLLKLRPRKDLVETLLHEMIHAYLFVTANNKDRNAHGPEFLKHMSRINKEAGTKISVYHSFHDEVDLYRKHWWKCNGPCQNRRPFFGLVKRAMNRAPGPHDTWWLQHQSSCGGEFIKIKEPENFKKKSLKRKPLKNSNHSQDITNFLSQSSVDSSNSAPPNSKKIKESNDTDYIKSILGEEDNCILMNSGSRNLSSFHTNVNNITPFSGQGFQLGSSSSTQPRSFLANIRRELASSTQPRSLLANIPRELASSSSNSSTFNSALNHNQLGLFPNLKETKNEEVKVKDHFMNKSKRASISESDRLVQSSMQKYVISPKQVSKVENNKNNSEIQLIQENTNMEVECPICFQSFTNLNINAHLDSCLSKGS